MVTHVFFFFFSGTKKEADSSQADNDKRFECLDYDEDDPFGVEKKTIDGHHETNEENDVDNASSVDPYDYKEDDEDHDVSWFLYIKFISLFLYC